MTGPPDHYRRGSSVGLTADSIGVTGHMKRILAALSLVSIVTLGLALGSVGQPDTTNILTPPSAVHWFGTDALGRDLGLRLLQACALSLLVSGLAWAVALAVGIAIGATAAYIEVSPVARAIDELIAITYATPFLVVLVGILGLLGPGTVNAYVVLLLFAWAAPARHTMSIVRHLRNATHVRAVLALGFRPSQTIRFVLVPEVLPAVVTASLSVLPEILALDVALSFFGLGAQPPTPTIGGLLVDGLAYGTVAWWVVLFPVLFLSVICLLMRGLKI